MEGKKVVLEFVVYWEGGAALISTFKVWDVDFYLNKHVSSIIVEQ